MDLVEFTEKLVKGIVKEEEMVKVKQFSKD